MDSRISKAGALYASGMSTTDVAAAMGVSRSTACLYVKKSGVEIDKNARIAKKAKGRPGTRLGKKHSDEAKRKMSESRKGKAVTTGTRRTEEQKQRMREAQARRKASGCFMTIEEKNKKEKVRQACKRFIRRLVKAGVMQKLTKTEIHLGYSRYELRERIEKQFVDGMCWETKNSFHIDHIIPVSWFINNGITDPAVINHLDNLRPMNPYLNQSKQDKLPENYEEILVKILPPEKPINRVITARTPKEFIPGIVEV